MSAMEWLNFVSNLWGTPYSHTHNSLVLDKSLFHSLPVLKCAFFFLCSPIAKSLLSSITIFTNLVILAVSYEKCHTVTTLPFNVYRGDMQYIYK